jgi:ABC-type transport system involved in multi-copper enzyme maturation permease subunit
MRWGPGPVFLYECLVGSRRWQGYALRSFGVGALLVGMGLIALSAEAQSAASSAQTYAELGSAYFAVLIGTELALVMLAAPAATAGAICVDRARGTLEHMLMTDLSDTEIVVGKLAARLVPVLGLVACSWPVMAISSLLGGIDPIALNIALAVILAVAVLGCTLALALSVWARKTHEVILGTYTVFIAGLLLWPVWSGLSLARASAPPPEWTLLANPFYVVFAPYAAPAKLGGRDYAGFFGAVLGASAVLLVLAVWRTRPVARRGSAAASKGSGLRLVGRLGRWLPGPSLDRNPVLWREWHRSRPSAWMLAILALLMGTTAVLCVVGAAVFWSRPNGTTPNAWATAGMVGYLLHAIFGLLLLSAVAPTSMSEDRQRGSLDLLAVTTLSTRAIVAGKWLGTFRLALLIAIAPGLMALAMATYHPNPATTGAPRPPPWFAGARIYGAIVVIATIAAHGALLTSAGLALAVWMKRQSRAIAASVALFVLVTAVWPIVVTVIHGERELGLYLAHLSPVVSLFQFAMFLNWRGFMSDDAILWWGTLWPTELFALALALLWLTAGTFDQCFDLPSDRPRRMPIRAALVVVLAVLMGAGSVVAALDGWIRGVLPRDPQPWTATGISIYAFLIALGMVVAATVAFAPIPASRPRPADAADEMRAMASGPFVWSHWWAAFRLVILLAIGPGILALALATAQKTILPVAKETKLPSGSTEITWEQPDPATANVDRIGEVRLGPRLACAALFIVTILVHGAAFANIGLALAIAFRGRRRAVSAAISLVISLAVGVPLYLDTTRHAYNPDAGLWNFILAAGPLLGALVTRISPNIREVLVEVLLWDVVMFLVAIGVFSWSNWARQRASGRLRQSTPSGRQEVEEPPALGASITPGAESRLPLKH